jgi:hypothetical protein
MNSVMAMMSCVILLTDINDGFDVRMPPLMIVLSMMVFMIVHDGLVDCDIVSSLDVIDN